MQQQPVTYPVIIPDNFPLIISTGNSTACSDNCCQTKKQQKRTVAAVSASGDLPLSLTTVIQVTMIMMASIIAICGYLACTAGEFTCTLQHWPDISHIMGVAPRNKLYAIMLTIYSCTKQAEARAYHDKLSTFVSPLVNSLLLLCALASLMFGPCIGYWDCYYDMDMHCSVTQIFTIGEIAYVFILFYVLDTNRDQFDPKTYIYMDRIKLALFLVAIDGIFMSLGNGYLGINIAQIGEWIAFFIDFYCRF